MMLQTIFVKFITHFTLLQVSSLYYDIAVRNCFRLRINSIIIRETNLPYGFAFIRGNMIEHRYLIRRELYSFKTAITSSSINALPSPFHRSIKSRRDAIVVDGAAERHCEIHRTIREQRAHKGHFH